MFEYWTFLSTMPPILGLTIVFTLYFVCFLSFRFIFGLLPRGLHWGPLNISSVKTPIGLLAALPLFFWFHSQIQADELIKTVAYRSAKGIFHLSAFWILYQFSFFLFKRLKKVTAKTESRLDDQFVPILEKIFRLLVVTLGALMILQSFGVDVFSIIAGLGLGGLALALAAKDTAANLFGSLMILLDQPFNIGDWVKINKIEGTVEDIGIRSTRIRTFYNSIQIVPNSTVANQTIDNMGRRKYRRFRETVGFEYGTPKETLDEFSHELRAWLQSNEKVVDERTQIHVHALGESSIEVLVHVFFQVNDWGEELQERENLVHKILELSDSLKAPIAFPTQSLIVSSPITAL